MIIAYDNNKSYLHYQSVNISWLGTLWIGCLLWRSLYDGQIFLFAACPTWIWSILDTKIKFKTFQINSGSPLMWLKSHCYPTFLLQLSINWNFSADVSQMQNNVTSYSHAQAESWIQLLLHRSVPQCYRQAVTVRN